MTRPRAAALSVVFCAAVAPACGMRGDPLPPQVIAPGRPGRLTAERFGRQVYVRFTVPRNNRDGARPADVDRIELYALTAPAAAGRPEMPIDEWLDTAALVATLPVAAPEAADGEAADGRGDAAPSAGDPIYAQGDRVTVVEQLTPGVMQPAPVDGVDRDGRGAVAVGPLAGAPPPRPPQRTYVALAVSSRGRASRPSRRESAPMGPPPAPPGAPSVTYDEGRIAFEWSPPATARVAVQQAARGQTLPSEPVLPPPPPLRYQVYDVTDPPPAGAPRVPEPLQRSPRRRTSYVNRNVTFGVERCFAVRAVAAIGDLDVRSEPSASTCVEFVDTFPPAAPTGLVAVAGGGVVSLAWTANEEGDVAGYRVLRGRGPDPDAPLDLLTAEPIAATTYRDAAVEAGVSYVYAVQAVDDAEPPNVGLPSERVVEQAR